MSRIFISYAHEDQAAAKRIVDGLAREGLDAWWDHAIPPGRTWDEVIGSHIASADIAIVIWSKISVVSNFVKEEAQIAYEAGKLLPVRVDDVEPPVGFRRVHAANLIGWRGDGNHVPWRALLDEIRGRLFGEAQPAPARHPPKIRRSPAPLVIGLIALFVIATGIGAITYFMPEEPKETNLPTVEAGADQLPLRDIEAELEAARREERDRARQEQRATAQAERERESLLLAERQRLAQEQQQSEEEAPPAVSLPDPATIALAALDRISSRDWSALGGEQLARRVLNNSSLVAIQAAAASDARAQTILGSAHFYGIGGAVQDDTAAVRFYRLAASQGFARAQANLGAMYADGRGVTRDYAEAERLFRHAANQGSAWGQNNLGAMYARGVGVTRDTDEAVRLYRLAARQGNELAQSNLRSAGLSW
ncbi:MAG: toll/interleukin-1 receptor domain-containing protein [Phycisphaerales bacterium]|nr:toll/interleukin-1 receptor domain-containing protein [Hyphomonadaceae bacterium]